MLSKYISASCHFTDDILTFNTLWKVAGTFLTWNGIRISWYRPLRLVNVVFCGLEHQFRFINVSRCHLGSKKCTHCPANQYFCLFCGADTSRKSSRCLVFGSQHGTGGSRLSFVRGELRFPFWCCWLNYIFLEHPVDLRCCKLLCCRLSPVRCTMSRAVVDAT